jgi:hypothetical protein
MVSSFLSEAASGMAADDIIPRGYVDPARSLEPFLIFYDNQGNPKSGTGYLDQVLPAPPQGIFAFVRTHGAEKFTWQPQPGVRIATVIQRVDGPSPGFILAGRSLKIVEEEEDLLRRGTFFGWFFIMLLIAGSALLLHRVQSKRIHFI